MRAWLGLGAAAITLLAAVLWFRWRKRKKAVYRKELPRVFELHDLVETPRPANAYFRDFDSSLAMYPQKRKQFRDIESELQGLESQAWAQLKTEVASLLTAIDSTRGWQALFDILNQAKAYNYLKRLGCTKIGFIPVSRARGQLTPDLGADLGSVNVLCEVKTINISEEEATRRQSGGVGTITDRLEDGFFNKLTSNLVRAKAQMVAYGADSATKMIAYVVINFDDSFHEYADRYQVQIDQYVSSDPVPGLEIAFDIKPAFYASMS
jgi:hypothetical protein